MIIHDVEQGTEAWYAARRGIPTASEFDKIITAGGKKSTQSTDYMDRLIAEYMTEESCNSFKGNKDTERGKELEPEARSSYELTFGKTVNLVGFITDDKKTLGCSPDGLIDDDGGLEMKCPAANTMIFYMRTRKLADEYKVQIQGNLLVTGRKWWDVWAYHPKTKGIHIRVERDTAFIIEMSRLLSEFNREMLNRLQLLRDEGFLEYKADDRRNDPGRFLGAG